MGRLIVLMTLMGTLVFASQSQEIKALDNKIGDNKRFAKLFYQRGVLYAAGGEYENAIADYEKAKVFDALYKDVNLRLLQAHLHNNAFEIVITLAPSYIKKAGKNDKRAYELVYANALFHDEEHEEEGIAIYNKYMKSHQGLSAKESVHFAEAYYAMGESREAIKVLKDGLRKDVGNYELNEKLATIALDDASYTLAETIIDRMLKQKTHLAKSYYLQARLYDATGEKDKAVKSSQMARTHFNKLSQEKRYLAANKLLEKNLEALEIKLSKKTALAYN